jgi:hypothetical protein
MKLGQAATFSCSTTFSTLVTPLTNLLWHVVKMVFINTPGPGRPAKGVGPAGPTVGQLGPGLVPRRPFMSYCPWAPLVLDIIKICIDFGPYGAFPSSDVPIMVDQQNLCNSLVISTYLLYLEWNIGMLAVTIRILWPPTLTLLCSATLRGALSWLSLGGVAASPQQGSEVRFMKHKWIWLVLWGRVFFVQQHLRSSDAFVGSRMQNSGKRSIILML